MEKTKMKKRCEICNIELDEHDLTNHIQGKRHLKNVEADNYKRGFLEKSIYVSRMPPGLTMDNVVNFFTQFGVIEKCKLEPHFAIIEFRKNFGKIGCLGISLNGNLSKKSIPLLADFQNGGLRLFVTLVRNPYDRRYSTIPEVPPAFLRVYDVGRKKLRNRISKVYLKSKQFDYSSRESVNFLLSRPIWMGRHKLDIKRRKWNNSVPTNAKQGQQDPEKTINEIVFAELKTKLQSQETFEEEASIFLETIKLNEEEIENNWQAINSSLLEALKPVFPNCEITRFGSSITGLCFKGSDIDIYLNIGQKIYEDEDKTLGWTPRTIFKEVKFYMYKRKNIFERIVPIPKAKTPIIKFCHAPTVTNCDISFKNGLGVINSQLIKQLLCLDVRLKPLMLIIKYWAKTFELSGCGKFTNYAIVMMIIFYLQQPEINILPAILEFRKTSEPVYMWNWQVNFDRQFVFPPSENKSSITELLAGFFKFYVNFPFEKSLISPLDGLAHSRADFAKVCAEKGGDADYLSLDRPICLQDPIELDNNITYGVTAKILETFQSYCAVGVEVCDLALENPNKPFLLNLFTTLPAPLDNQAFQQITISARKTLTAGLPADFETRDDIGDKKKFTENNWYTLTQGLVIDALRRVFKMDVQTVKSDREAKQQKVAQTSDVHSKDNDKVVLECTGDYYCVISGRKSKSFCLDPTLSQIDKEALISTELVKKQKDDGVRPMKIDFTCTITREQNPVRLVLRLMDRNSAKKLFRRLASFLSTKLPSIIDKELIHIIQYDKHPDLSL